MGPVHSSLNVDSAWVRSIPVYMSIQHGSGPFRECVIDEILKGTMMEILKLIQLKTMETGYLIMDFM